MRARFAAAVPALAVLWSACSSTPVERPVGASRPTPQIPPTTGSAPPGGRTCGYEPPPLRAPESGALLSGMVVLIAPLLEGPCYVTASVVFTVTDASGRVVYRGCDNDIPARGFWDTTLTENGAYRITTQRACSCNTCDEAFHVDVTVANPLTPGGGAALRAPGVPPRASLRSSAARASGRRSAPAPTRNRG
jgi:hypothetical protein